MSTTDHDQPLAPTPADLVGIAGALDRLARIEQDAAPGLEDRLFAASRTVLAPVPRDIAEINAAADRLAAIEATAAGPRLEASVVAHSRQPLSANQPAPTAEPVLHLAGGPIEPPRVTVRPVRRLWSATKVAAVLALAATGALIIYRAVAPSTPTDPPTVLAMTPSVEQLSEQFDSEMEALWEVMGQDREVADNSDTEADPDASWIDELFNQESL